MTIPEYMGSIIKRVTPEMIKAVEVYEAKAAAIEAITQWSIIGARERAEVLGKLGDDREVFSLQDLLMFWAEHCPEVLQMLLKAGAIDYMEAEDDHASG